MIAKPHLVLNTHSHKEHYLYLWTLAHGYTQYCFILAWVFLIWTQQMLSKYSTEMNSVLGSPDHKKFKDSIGAFTRALVGTQYIRASS